jgi:hypothetical protein
VLRTTATESDELPEEEVRTHQSTAAKEEDKVVVLQVYDRGDLDGRSM